MCKYVMIQNLLQCGLQNPLRSVRYQIARAPTCCLLNEPNLIKSYCVISNQKCYTYLPTAYTGMIFF